MSKAILVMDMPENCAKCKLSSCLIPKGVGICCVDRKRFDDMTKVQDWCPLQIVQYYSDGLIPVEERLPEIKQNGESEEVLAALRWFDGGITYKIAIYHEKYGWNTFSEHNEVIAWMPLPDKIKED